MALTLYTNPVSTAARPVMLFIAEKKLPVEYRVLDMMKGEHKGADYLAINPNGQVPTLEDGDFRMTESSAILKYLAARFNAAAERVQTLLQSHKALLANASHELRSPLTRIRMGLALVGSDPAHQAQRAEIARNIDELDQLIDEILLASRLDLSDPSNPAALGPEEEVDLLGLAAEECARAEVELEVAPQAGAVVVRVA